MNIAEYIQERRLAKGWSKRKLALEAGISHTEVHRIESGERKHPSANVLSAIAEALDIPKKELLKIAGYIDDSNGNGSPIEQAFPDLKTPKQQETLQKIVDGLARNQDLEDEDYENLVEHMEMFLAYAKKKKNPR